MKELSIHINFFKEVWSLLYNPSGKSEFRANTLRLFKAILISQAIALLTAPVISRLYKPSSIGILALFISISSIFTTIMSFRYEQAIVLPAEEEKAVNVLALSVLIVMIMTFMSFLVMFFFGEKIGNIFRISELKNWVIFLPLSLFANGIYNSLSYWTTRGKKFNMLAMAAIIQSSSSAFYKIVYGAFLVAATQALIIGQVIGQVLSSITLLSQCLEKNFKQLVLKIKWDEIKKSAIEYKKFPLYTSWSAVLSVLSKQIPAVLLALFFNPTIVGFYALGYKLVSIPLEFVTQSVSKVFYQKVSEIKNTGGSISNVYWKMFKSLLFISIAPTLILGLFSKYIFMIFLGDIWSEAGLYVQILSPLLLFRFISVPVTTILLVYNKQQFDFIFNLILFISTVISISIGGIMKNPVLAIYALSFSLSLSHILLMFIQIKVVREEDIR